MCEEAIRQFRKPKTQNKVRLFLGIPNYVFKFVTNIANKTVIAWITNKTNNLYEQTIKMRI